MAIVEGQLIGEGCEQYFGIPASQMAPFKKEGPSEAARVLYVLA
jgi:hypothetical protein